MNQKTLLIIISGIVAFVLLALLLLPVALEPWAEKKIQDKFIDKVPDYLLDIGKLNISLLKRGVDMEKINLISKQDKDGVPVMKAEIASVSIKGVKLLKALFRKDIEIIEVTISGSRVTGEFTSTEKAVWAKISPLNITIDHLILDNFSLDIKSDSTAQAYMISDGSIIFQNLKVEKSDTITTDILNKFDFNADELKTVTADSLYTFAASGIHYSGVSYTLSVSNFALQPNYANYEFTSRHEFEADRIEAEFSQVSVHDFCAEDYIKSGNLTISYIEISEIAMNVFRDKREQFRHVSRPMLQDLIYSFPGKLDIDSLGILHGNIIYTEHAEEANETGTVQFDELKAMIYNISNDTIYKTKKAYLEINAEALLMGKGKVNLLLRGRIFDRENTLDISGNLSTMEAMEMNPILEKSAFLYVTSGNIENLNFNFTTNRTRSTGNLKFIYNGLNLTIKNKQTDDTTAFKERFISMIANMKIMDSNPLPGEEVRNGIIDYERDPEKFLFSYFVKSLMSGLRSSIVKAPKGSEK